MYRPQFPMADAPAGWEWHPCVYQFDSTNTPAFGNIVLSTGAETGYIPLHMDKDACFVLLACKIIADAFDVLLFDPFTNQLMDDFTPSTLYAESRVPVTTLEGPGIEAPAGSAFSVRLRGK